MRIKKISERLSNEPVYDIEVDSGDHLFQVNGVTAHNCRLLSDTDMLAMGSQMNSFGGAGVSLGSHRVVTINFNRIALEASSYEDYFNKILARTEDAAKILRAHKDLLIDEEKKGLLPFISNGYISFNKLFSTFGFLGLYEARKTLERRFGQIDEDIVASSLGMLNTKVAELSTKYNIFGNIEQIPGESIAVKFRNVDAMLFGEEVSEYPLYANQFVPLWEDADVWTRMRADGKYNKKITGGSIAHFNLGERVTPQQAERLIDYAVESGCQFFALNSVYSKCEDGHMSFGKHEACPICKKRIVDQFTRIVGFFTPVSSWNKTRRTWEFERRKFGSIDDKAL